MRGVGDVVVHPEMLRHLSGVSRKEPPQGINTPETPAAVMANDSEEIWVGHGHQGGCLPRVALSISGAAVVPIVRMLSRSHLVKNPIVNRNFHCLGSNQQR